jgi:TPR repeat protein
VKYIVSFLFLFTAFNVFPELYIPSDSDIKDTKRLEALYKENKFLEIYQELEEKKDNPYFKLLYALNILYSPDEWPFNDDLKAYQLLIESVQDGHAPAAYSLPYSLMKLKGNFRTQAQIESLYLVSKFYYRHPNTISPRLVSYFLSLIGDMDGVIELNKPKTVKLGTMLDIKPINPLGDNLRPAPILNQELKVSYVLEGSAAALAGILKDDVLLSIDGVLLRSFPGLQEILEAKDSFSVSKIKILRKGKELILPLKFLSKSYRDDMEVLSALSVNPTSEMYEFASSQSESFAKDLVLCNSFILELGVKRDVEKGIEYCSRSVTRYENLINKPGLSNMTISQEVSQAHWDNFRRDPLYYWAYRSALLRLGHYYSGFYKYQQENPNPELALNYLSHATVVSLSPETMYLIGHVEDKLGNKEKAFEYFVEAAKRGSRTAHYALGDLYIDDEHVRYDPELAIFHFKEAHEMKFQDASLRLYFIYSEGKVTKQNENKAKEYLLEAVENKNAYAVFKAGTYYYDGKSGFERDREKAKKLLLRSVDLGHSYAKNVVAYFIFDNPYLFQPTTNQLREAEDLLVINANKGGDKVKLYTLMGTRYYQGIDHIPEDLDSACQYFEELNNLGSIYGTFMFANCGSQDTTEAISLLSKASLGGSSRASFLLGEFYEKGEIGFPRNLGKAETYFSAAVNYRRTESNQNYYQDLYVEDMLQIDLITAQQSLSRVRSSITKMADAETRRITALAADRRRVADLKDRNKRNNTQQNSSNGFGNFLGNLFKAALVVAVANEAVQTWEDTSDRNKNSILKSLDSSLNSGSSGYDWDWDWDAFYDQYGNLQWRCRGIQTGRFAKNYNCSSDYKDDDRWPRK